MADECKEIILSGAKNIKIAPLGVAKEAATDLGFTGDNVVLTSAAEFAEIRVDQRLSIVRRIITALKWTIAIPAKCINLHNLALGLGVEFDASGWASAPAEKYYQIWFDSDAPIKENGVKGVRHFYLPKVSLGGTAELAFSRTESQTDNIEGAIVNCDDSQYFQITEEYDEESGESGESGI